MSTNVNNVTVSGNITRDPELRATAGGTSVATFGIAYTQSSRNRQTGEWEDHTSFFDCVAFGERAESLARRVAKGQKAVVQGTLHQHKWEDKEGNRRSTVEIVVLGLDAIAAPKAGGAQSASVPEPTQTQPQPQQAEYTPLYESDVEW